MSHHHYQNADMAPLSPAANSSQRKVRFQAPGSSAQEAPATQSAINLAGVHFDPPTASIHNGPRVHYYNPSSDFTPAAGLVYSQSPCSAHGHQNNYCYTPIQPHVTTPAPAITPTPTYYVPGAYPQPQPDIAGFSGSAHQIRHQIATLSPRVEADPALGIGLTESQTAAESLRKGLEEGASNGGEFKPANPDKNQQYWVQEMNGAVVLMPRRVIDRMAVRWVMRGGDFVAVRLDAGPRVQ